MTQGAALVLRGWSGRPGATMLETTVRLETQGFSVTAGTAAPWWAAYRDVCRVEIESGAVRLRVGAADAEPLHFERFGSMLPTLARGLREGRFRQWLTDGFIEAPADAPIELVEMTGDVVDGIAQILYHDRGVAIGPLDERSDRVRIRRADIRAVAAEEGSGRLMVSTDRGELQMVGLGAHEESHRQRWLARRDGAIADMAAILDARLADASFEVRRRAAVALVEGRPAGHATLGDAFPVVEAAMLDDPDFAASYRALVARAGGPSTGRWVAVAPADPGATDDVRAWFLVPLPGNLLALELVSAGAHATYLFRVAPRASFAGTTDPAELAAAVADVSEALIDARFLREPMALPAERLAEPRHLRYRLALAVLPSLVAARDRFVARVVHADPTSWGAAIDDVIAWHGAARGDETWPGRASQEAAIAAAGPDGATDQTDGDTAS